MPVLLSQSPSFARLRTILLLILLIAAGAVGTASAQGGTITGTVADPSGAPLSSAQIVLVGTGVAAVTGSDGTYRLTNAPAGSHTLLARLIGRRPDSASVTVIEGQTATHDFTLVEDPLTLEALVVTGTRTPERKLESSTAITTLNAEEVRERAPRSTADLLSAVPGFYVESSGGEVGGNLFARGLPADGSYRYVALMEDGMPVFDATELSFVNADIFVRADENLDRIEALRGGNSALFGSNAPGGVINFISKTGGPTFGGTLGATGGTSGMNRYDFNFNGPLMRDWAFSVGGFYRFDNGVRDPGFPSSVGGQLKANVTREFDRGFVRLYTKYLNDRNTFFLPLPIEGVFDADGGLSETEFVAGFPDDGTLASREGVDLRVPLPRNNGDLVLPLDDGQRQRGGSAQLEIGLDLGQDWSINNRLRYMNMDHQWNAMLPFELVDADLWAQGFVGGTPGGAGYRLSCTNVRDAAGAKVAFGSTTCPTANNLLTLGGEWHVEVPMSSLANQLQLTKFVDAGSTRHTFTVGSYFSHYTADNRWFFNDIVTDVKDQPSFVDLEVLDAAGAPVRAVTDNGFRQYLGLFVNGTGNVTIASAFAGDQIEIGDRWRLDVGGRYEHNEVDSDVENTAVFDVNTTDAGTGASFGSGTFRRVNVGFDEWAASVGLNYLLTEQAALYVRGSRGYKMPILSNYLFATDPAAESFPDQAEQLLQAEGGIKFGSQRVGVTLVGYWLQIKDFPSQDVQVVDGVTQFVTAFVGQARTIGAELEAVVQPVDFFRINASITAQDPKYTDFFEGGEDNTGNRIRRIPRFVSDLTGTFMYGGLSLRGNWSYVGDRFSNNSNTIDLPGFGVVNAGARYRLENGLAFQANALNLLDGAGLTEGNPRVDESLGGLSNIFLARPILPRTFTAGVRYDF
ncbi:MAG: TonB-dependent receptor [Gemmatimonadales bacterium]